MSDDSLDTLPSETPPAGVAWEHFVRTTQGGQENIGGNTATEVPERRSTATPRGRTPIPFAGVASRLEAQKQTDEERERRWLHLCATHHAKHKNAEENHAALHIWLMEHDEDYRRSDEISHCCEELRRDLGPVINMTVGLLAGYVATRNEVALARNAPLNKIPGVALAALVRLIGMHSPIVAAMEVISGKIATLNRKVAGTVYGDLRLRIPARIVAPDCAEGMSFSALRTNFETSAEKTRECVRLLEEMMELMESVPGTMEHILFDYREALRSRHLNEDTRSDTGLMAG